ncbi:MAG: hypothetical protein Q8N16_02020 [bacterium]|nr:hypothetical protein [bacterium]
MEIQEYLSTKLKNCTSYEYTTEDKKLLDDFGIEEFIYKKLTSKKFRKYALSPDCQKHIMSVIHKSVETRQKISFVWVFGGYKLWRLAESPEPDWAELFSMIYFIDWLKPIIAAYPPGVHFDFFSDDVIVPIMNNIPQEDTKHYIAGFKNLLDFVKPHIPSNFLFTLSRVEDQYESHEDFKKDLEIEIAKRTGELGGTGKFPSLTPEQIQAIELNVKSDTEQVKDPFWRERVQIIHDSYVQISKRRPYYRNENTIMVVSTSLPVTIAVGSTKTSVVKFWVGAGALERRNESYAEWIFSPKQIASRNFSIEPIELEGLTGKNFSQIRVLK